MRHFSGPLKIEGSRIAGLVMFSVQIPLLDKGLKTL